MIDLDDLRRHGDLLKFALLHPILPAAGTYRTRVVKDAGGYCEELWQSEDYHFNIKLALKGISYEVIPQALVKLRQRAESRSQKLMEVWLCAFQGIQMLAGEIPESHRPFLAQAAARAGAKLFELGDEADATKAFELATSVSPGQFPPRGRFYRSVAQWVGPMMAERLGRYYRKFVPQVIRQLANKL